MRALARVMCFDLESEWTRTREKGFFTNNDLRTAVSSLANDVVERDFTVARGGVIPESDSRYVLSLL